MLNHLITARNATRELGLLRGLSAYLNRVLKIAFSSRTALSAVKLRSAQAPIFIRAGTSDWHAFTQVFLNREYSCGSKIHQERLDKCYRDYLSAGTTPVIIDCGANIGTASVYFALRYPEALIFSIEPDMENYAILLKNSMDYKHITPVHAAVSDQQTMVTMSNATGEPWAWQTTECDGGTVKTTTISNIMSGRTKERLFIVKIDIEGSEIQLFRSDTTWADTTPLIVFETHDVGYPWHGTAHSIFSVLTKVRRDYVQNGEYTFAFLHLD